MLLKASVLNQLYATNVFAIFDMAGHICEVIGAYQGPAGPPLVEKIALMRFGDKERRFVSFASKYAHFFIDPSTFPIVDISRAGRWPPCWARRAAAPRRGGGITRSFVSRSIA